MTLQYFVARCYMFGLFGYNELSSGITPPPHLITGLFQEVEALRFQDSWHMRVVRLSALRIKTKYINVQHWMTDVKVLRLYVILHLF